MDLKQNKLSKAEWESIEKSVDDNEKKILKMIVDGYDDVNIRFNETQSLNNYIHFDQTTEMDYFLHKRYFEQRMVANLKEYIDGTHFGNYECRINLGKLKKLKSGEMIRLNNLEKNIELNKSSIFEFLLIDLYTGLVKNVKKRKNYAFYLYTIIQLRKAKITNINRYVLDIINYAVEYVNSLTSLSNIITNAYEFIEQNKYLLKYEDRTLFNHQRELFTICKQNANRVSPLSVEEYEEDEEEPEIKIPMLILYTAPTGTGKTLSPIGLATSNRVIFVCVARHIGLALAKSAITMEKKVAFAFGCETAADIRLHYFSAKDYTRNKRTGGIAKVDNSVGDNVEIMICDVQSYITAMHYMIAFNDVNDIITYWDEPTITLDYENHDLHEVIHNNWKNNLVPTMVLSCATLPTTDEMRPVYDDFRSKFEDAEIITITSYDCKKSIPILDKDLYCALPHYLYDDYSEILVTVKHCKQNPTILRYFDLREIIKFIKYVNEEEYIDERYTIDSYFGVDITNITMNRLKEYYLDVLLHVNSSRWTTIYNYMKHLRKPRYNEPRTNTYVQRVSSMGALTSVPKGGNVLTRTLSTANQKQPAVTQKNAAPVGVSITTQDAYTLTDGPTIFLTDDVDKIGKYYIALTNIPKHSFDEIQPKIDINSKLTKKIDKLERDIEHQNEKSNTSWENSKMTKEARALDAEITELRKQVQIVSLDSVFIPNTCPHQGRWTPDGSVRENAFVSSIGEQMSKEIMLLDVEMHIKYLLLLGIGVFKQIPDKRYMEIMKQLADEQRLFIIIASTDYIYGTNYQFCHGFIAKDLNGMTQQKTLQSMGRVGRNNIQQDYTVRFRDNDMISKLFKPPENNMEAINLCKLFTSD
jgi:hypothetical protein